VTLGGRPTMPPPGVPTEELLIARFRGHARRLFWSAVVLIAVFGATAYFYGNLPAPFENWMMLTAACLAILLLVVVPFVVWYSRSVTVTTRRVIVSNGVGSRNRQEMSHARGYAIGVKRGVVQRMWGVGTITLSNGVDTPLRLANVPNVTLVHETLADQIEVSQILAHRDAQSSQDSPSGF
jgi:membrane protein YdbS with pleckstrin-like domain